MGTVVKRKRKDGSANFSAQIILKRNREVVWRESRTFDTKQLAYAWLEKRENELRAPGGLDRVEDPALAEVIGRYSQSRRSISTFKAKLDISAQWRWGASSSARASRVRPPSSIHFPRQELGSLNELTASPCS